MGFGDDLRGELFGKLGVESDADPLKNIQEGILAKQEGNNQGAKKLFEQALQLAGDQAAKFTGQSQHRAAAEAYYIQAMAQGHLGMEDEQSNTYKEVIDRLLEAGKVAIAFGENQRGIACATLAGMVALMDEDQLRAKQIYSEYINTAQEKEDGAHLAKLLYALGYLLDALENDNVGAITDAQNYISTDLKPMLSTAKLAGFESLLDSVLTHTQETLQGQITMPKIQLGTSLPRYIQFNQLFEFELKLTNSGEGVASSMVLNFDVPGDLEIVDGKTEEQFPALNPDSTETRTLQMRFQTGDTSGEVTREIKGSVSYVDMLGNSHKQFFGPIEMEFTAFSKKEEFEKQLRSLTADFDQINEENLNSNVFPAILDLFKGQISSLKTSISEKLAEEQFDEVEFGLKTLDSIVKQAQELTQENELTNSFKTEIDEIVEKIKVSYKEELETKFNEEKEEALQELRDQKEKELNERVEQLKRDLSEQYSKDLNSEKDQHQSALQQANREYEQKLNNSLVQHENKLKDEFKDEKAKLVSDHENVIKDLQNKHQKELETATKDVREELTSKYEARISELENSRDEVKNQLTNQYSDEKSQELADLKTRLNTEKETALKQKEEEITARITQEYEEKLAAKDAEIERLKSNQ